MRALAAGPEGCVAAAGRDPGFEPADFADFLAAHNLREWVRPLLAEPAGRGLLPEDFARALSAECDSDADRKRDLLELSVDIRDACATAGIPCLFMKGLYFGDRLYGDVGRRHQYDVDVLVPRPDLERVVALLGGRGFDVGTNLDDDSPVELRLREIRSLSPQRAPHAVTVRRKGVKADVHWCLSSRSVGRVDERKVWARRQRYRLGDQEFETLADADILMFLLVSIGVDLRRGACRQKNFLDLYLLLRQLGPGFDWKGFLADRRREQLQKVSVNVLAIFLDTWNCRDELPELARALEPHARQLEHASPAEALKIVTRPRGNHANRYWFRRVYPRSQAIYWVWRLTRDLPHQLRQRVFPQRVGAADAEVGR